MVAFAVMLPVLVGSVGMSMDLAQTFLVRQRLAGSLDAAALAATASSTDEDEIRSRVEDFFDANYPEDKIGVPYDLDVDIGDDEVTVSAYADYDTTFMRVLGISEIAVYRQTTVQRDVQGLEVVLVLDNTGSMSTNDNIGALRTATANFINILFDATSQPEYIKIGMVPYSNSVRIGRYGLGLNPDGTAYGDGDVFVTLPTGVTYTTSHNTTTANRWYGCIVEHMDADYNSAATHVSGARGQLWSTATGANSTRCSSAASCRGHGWRPDSSSNDPYPQDVEDDYEGPWDIYMWGKIIANNAKCTDSPSSGYSNSRCSGCTGSNSRCAQTYCFCEYNTENDGCPYAYVLPLTSDQEELLDRVDDMQPEGNTLGNVGMAWGYRLISPEAPFTEAEPWENDHWRKAIIMMTDGDNTIDSGSSGYSYYGPGSKNTMTVDDLNDRYAEVCDALREQGVLVYTVTFYSNINDETKQFYRECATNESMYYDAPSQDDLVEVFERISRELANLHISD